MSDFANNWFEMDRVESLRVFARVVECGTFTRAAHQLQMPRSTVSTAVKSLEDRVGVRLLTRTTRSVSLTQDGRAFYERCQRVLNDYDELETLFQESSKPPSGRLVVNVPGRMGRRIFAPALPEFLDQYPDIDIELGVTDRAVDLIQEGIDCVVRVGELAETSLVARSVGSLKLVNCASPSYLKRYGKPKSVSDLSKHLAVHYASPTTGRIEAWEVEEKDGTLQEFKLSSRVTVTNAEGLIACCVAGLGLIQVPKYDVREHLERGTLVEVLPKARAAPLPLNILYPHRRHLSRRLRAFMDWAGTLLKRHTA